MYVISSVADPDPDPDPVGTGLFGSPGSGSGKKIYVGKEDNCHLTVWQPTVH